MNAIIVVIKVSIVIVVICVGFAYVNQANYTPFIPPNTGKFGEFGLSGIDAGRGGHLLRLHRLRRGLDGRPGGQEAAARHAHRHHRLAGRSARSSTFCSPACSPAWSTTRKFHGDASPVATVISLFPSALLQTTIVIGIICGYTSVILVMLLGQSRVFYSMSRDGLLPKVFSDIHPKFQTPCRCNMIFMVFVVALLRLPADLAARPHDQHRHAAGIRDRVYRNHHHAQDESSRAAALQDALVPLVPILGVLVCFAMMASLDIDTWIRLVVWLAIGLAIYFGYSRHHSHLSLSAKASTKR